MIANMLTNKTILVTGASSGIGKEIAIFFSQQGARVVLTGRNQERLNETLQNLSGRSHVVIAADLSTVDEIQTLMDNTYKAVGALDGVIHCAGIQKTLPLQALKNADFDDIFFANVKSAQFIAKFLRRKGHYNKTGASLLFMSSVAAICGEPAISTYSGSKADRKSVV